jgi:arginase
MKNQQWLHLIGVASGLGAGDRGCENGPRFLKESLLSHLSKNKLPYSWDALLEAKPMSYQTLENVIGDLCQQLALYIEGYARKRERFAVIGGDHSCAIGTWSGVYGAMADEGPFGLLWLDAHLDSHTPETTESGLINGMPLAALLGYGHPSFTRVLFPSPKLLPENVSILGVRSYEKGEYEFLKRLGVKVFYMEEIKKEGLARTFAHALNIVKSNTKAYGISLDLDVLDPKELPGVSFPVADGLHLQELSDLLTLVSDDALFLGFEIAEFNPKKDQVQKTEHSIVTLLQAMNFGKF